MYRVTCHSCGKPFDASTAAECTCFVPVRSFRCSQCAACFCEAPSAYQKNFWKSAPQDVWDRRKKRTAAQQTNEPPDLIQRPMVLFADDDPTSRVIARQLVTTLGFGVAVAADGEEALQLARDYRPELLITDALMPKLDGREVARMMREENPEMRIVVITSVYKDARYKHEALKNFGVDDFLPKPIKPADLRLVVERYLKPSS